MAIFRAMLPGQAEQPVDQRSDLPFRRLLENLPAAAYTCDAEGLITFYNQRALEMWGREPKLRDPVDRYCGSFRLFAPDGTPINHDRCWMARALIENRGYNGHEIVIERPDGSRWTVLAHANPIHDDSGTLIGAVNVLVDITDRKRGEIRLREADRAKNEFLAMLAHELRNPLAPMRYALDVSRRSADDPEAMERAHETIDRQIQHLTRIVDDLLDLSRITRNKLELRKARIDLASPIHQAVETCRPTVEAYDHELTVTVPDEPIFLEADAMRLAQLCSNLLTNAAKYTEPGGRIWLSVERQGSDAMVAVRDNGIGIEREQLAAIFEMFNQADGSLERAQDGLGIGLTLAERVVEMHGGSIHAYSEGLGRGSLFVVRLPTLIDAKHESPRPAERMPETGGERRRVLVVDDNPDAAESLAMLLELGGHETHLAHDGVEAIEAAERLQPDVILLDIGLPRLSGYDAARKIRRTAWGREMLLVAVTGWGQEDARQQSKDAGFDHHLVKPIDHALIETILAQIRPAAV